MTKSNDDEARDYIINAARMFLKEVLASKGRRIDVESNAFWARPLRLSPLMSSSTARAALLCVCLTSTTASSRRRPRCAGYWMPGREGGRLLRRVHTAISLSGVSSSTCFIATKHRMRTTLLRHLSGSTSPLTSQQNPTSTSFIRPEHTTTPKFACSNNFLPPLPSLQ